MIQQILDEIWYFGDNPSYSQDEWLLRIYLRKESYYGRYLDGLDRRAALYCFLKEEFQTKYPNTNWKQLTREVEAKRKTTSDWDYYSGFMQQELEDKYWQLESEGCYY